VIVILEDFVLFLFFIYIASIIRDNLLNWQLLCLIDLGYINDVELFAASTEICKQIIDGDISELCLMSSIESVVSKVSMPCLESSTEIM
jgi:hypothetical protein